MTQLPSTKSRQSLYSDPGSATITVLVPNQDAQVWFGDASTTQRGMERIFFPPGLGQAGTYTIRASWNHNGREVEKQRRIQLRPGQPVTVDFRTNSEKILPAPSPPSRRA